MTTSTVRPQTVRDPLTAPVVGPACHVPDVGWVVTRHCEVSAVLADPGFVVPAVVTGGPVGTIDWLRSSASRFANGPEHQVRRARACAVLADVPPELLNADAYALSLVAFDEMKGTYQIDIMSALARQVPMAVLAARLGFDDPDRAADAVVVTAAAYFPGARAADERAADQSTAELVEMLQPAEEEVIAAKIAVMVQGCDATASLIGKAVCLALPPGAEPSSCMTDALVSEVARYDPPLRVTRRVSREGGHVAGSPVFPGTAVLLHVDSANRDPEVFAAPTKFDPGRNDGSNLTFGYGLRPCPGEAHALALATGVVEAIRERCAAVIAPVEYQPPVNLRIPVRVVVSLL